MQDFHSTEQSGTLEYIAFATSLLMHQFQASISRVLPYNIQLIYFIHKHCVRILSTLHF